MHQGLEPSCEGSEKPMNEISKQNAETLGLDTMTFQTMEECGELIKAISKFNRTRGIGQKTEMAHRDAYLQMIEEMADVEICIEQLKYLLGCESMVDQAKIVAFEKVHNRYKGGENQ